MCGSERGQQLVIFEDELPVDGMSFLDKLRERVTKIVELFGLGEEAEEIVSERAVAGCEELNPDLLQVERERLRHEIEENDRIKKELSKYAPPKPRCYRIGL